MMTKMIQIAFIPPPMSRRRKMSAKTVIRSQIQMMNAKNTIISQRALKNG